MFIIVVMFLLISVYSTKGAMQSQCYEDKQASNPDDYNVMYIKSTRPHFDYKHAAEDFGGVGLGYPALQYAPLSLNSDEQAMYDKNNNKAEEEIEAVNAVKVTKSNLEPRLDDYSVVRSQTKESFIYGHNIQIPNIENKHPMYNMNYRHNAEITTEDNFKVSYEYINPYPYYRITEPETELVTVEPNDVQIRDNRFVTKAPRAGQIYSVISKNYDEAEKCKKDKVLSDKESPLIQPQQLLYVRPYRLHLNVARAFNAGNTPNNKAKIINEVPKDYEAALRNPESTHLLKIAEKKTNLYSTLNKYVHQVS